MNVGDRVDVRRNQVGGGDLVLKRGLTVAKVTANCTVLSDRSKWRADGYAWGSKPERGVGRFFAERIVPSPAAKKSDAGDDARLAR